MIRNTTLLTILSVLAIFTILSRTTVPAEADEPTCINVQDYGADGTDEESDRQAFWDALRDAGSQRSPDRTEVYVPDGIYYLDDYIGIYSNTWLHLSDGAKIVRMDGCETKSMLIGVHNDSSGNICYWNCTHTGYTQCVNVLVSGGEWSGGVSKEETYYNDQSLEVMSFRHAHSITIRDTVIGDTDGYHVINLDGVCDCYIQNVFFHDHMQNMVCDASEEDFKGREVIHTDIISNNNPYSSAYPIEELACRDVCVRDCIFQNCVSCIGTHNGVDGLYLDDFEVSGCTFQDVLFHCINAVQFTGVKVMNNDAQNVSCFISAYGCLGENTIEANTVSCTSHIQKESCIDICQGSVFSIIGNTVRSAGTHAISGANYGNSSKGNCEIAVKNNVIEESGNTGVYVRDGCIAAIENNIIRTQSNGTADRTIGIYINVADKGCTVQGNDISGYQYGIEACNSRDVLLEDNTITGASVYGISLYKSSDIDVTGCSITDCTIGLQVDGSKSTIKNLLMASNKNDINTINHSEVIDDSVREPEAQPVIPEEKNKTKQGSPEDKKTDNGGTKKSNKIESVPVYRVFNPRTGEHLYTQSKYERDILVQRGWHGEGIGWYAPKTSDKPVYRLYNPNSGEHHYTASQYERDWLSGLGWRYEGICWYSADKDGVPVYRHYHPRQKTGNHHYTTSKGESVHICRYEGWTYEGIGWYGLAS